MYINKIALLANFNRNRYIFNIMRSLCAAFHAEGIETQLVNTGQDSKALNTQLEELKPDVLFEINRTKWQRKESIPDEMVHIAWIHDAWQERTPDEPYQLHYRDPQFGGSQLIYTLCDPGYFGFTHHLQQGTWGRLHTGIDPGIHRAASNNCVQPNSASICGYIPLPVDTLIPHLTQQVIGWNQGKKITVQHMADFLLDKAQVSVCQHTYPDIHQLIAAEMSRYLDTEITPELLTGSMGNLPHFYLLDTELPRITDRLRVGKAIISAGLDLAIYGSDTWKLWPALADCYQKYLHWGQDLASVYQHTQFNVHTGCFGMHSRVLECMGSGGAIFVCTGRFNDSEHDISRHFVPNEHYIPFTLDNAQDTFASWKNQGSRLQNIARNASVDTHKSHTWRHRAQEILADVATLT